MNGGRIGPMVPLLLAVQFLTRLPVSGMIRPLDADLLRSGMRQSTLWFGLVGGLIGAASALVIVAAGHLWPRAVAVIVMLIVESRLTGAFHEDAVADYCDGMGGGMTAQRIREIMKDSRIGTYGALGLMLAVALRAATLIAMPQTLLVPAILASAAIGRWIAVVVMAVVPPLDQGQSLARDIGQSTGVLIPLGAGLLSLPFALPLAMAAPVKLALALALAGLFLIWFRGQLLRHLGGVSGDCLGFAVYTSQLIILLTASAAWPG